MFTRRRLLACLPVLAMSGVPSYAGAVEGGNPGQIRFGMSAPLTGPNGVYGRQMKEGIEAYFAKVNAEGGVGGRRLTLLALDDGYEPGAAVSNTRSLISKEKVFALMGFYGTASSTAVLPVLDEAGVPLIGTISGAENLRNPELRHIFHLRASYGDETAEITKNLVTVGLTRIAVLYQDDGFGKAGLAGMAAAMKPHNIAPITTASVPRNSLDVQAAVHKIVQANPQAVVMVTLYRPTAEFIRQMRNAGAAPHFVALSPVGTDQLIEMLGADNARGVQVSQVIPSPWGDKVEAVREYKTVLSAAGKGSGKYSYYGLEGFLNAKLVVSALRRAGGTPTRDGLEAALRAAPFDLGGYHVRFGPKTNAGSKYVEISVIGPSGRILN